MLNNDILARPRRLQALVAVAALSLAVAGCGGSGAGAAGHGAAIQNSDDGTGIGVNPNGTIKQPTLLLSLVNANGDNVTQAPSVAVGSALTLQVVAKKSDGSLVPNVVVTVTAPPVAALVPAVGTALTNDIGLAQLQVEGVGEGAGEISATATIIGTSASASIPLTVTRAGVTPDTTTTATSVAFIGASIPTLKIAGAVGESTSTITFKVVDQAGQPVANQDVLFAPSVTTGGLSVAPLSGKTAADGTVRTTVTAGVIPTPVRVRATTKINGVESTAQSLQLSISSGNPSQKFFSLSAEKLSIDGCNFDGEKTKVTARAGDQFGNPVPDGTTVNFVTEGGRIGADSAGSCQTVNGACGVELESQEYRPRGYTGAESFNNCRVSVLAYAVGEETFVDLNSNGRYDAGEEFEDLPDAFLDIEPNGEPFVSRSVLTPALVGDRLIPFKSDGRTAPAADGKWGDAHVRDWLEIGFAARSVAQPEVLSTPPNFAGCTRAQPGGAQAFTIRLADVNGNSLAAGSSVAVEGAGVAVGALIPSTVPNTNAQGSNHQLTVTPDATRCADPTTNPPTPAGASGQVRITVTPTNGSPQVFSYTVNYQ